MYKKLHKKTTPKKKLYKKSTQKTIKSLDSSKNIDNSDQVISKRKKLNKFKPYIRPNIKNTENIQLLNFYNSKKINKSSIVISLILLGLTSIFTLIKFNNTNQSVLNNIVIEKTTPIIVNPTTTVLHSNIIDTTTTSSPSIPTAVTTTIPLVIVDTIEDAQRQLKLLYIYQGKIDGVNGTYTKLAIKEFQNRSGLKVDGILGPLTKTAIEKGAESYINIDSQDSFDVNNYEVTDETKDIQNRLKELNIYTGDIDGIFGFQTMVSLKEFQKKAGLTIDGVYGPNTEEALSKGEEAYVKIKVTVDIVNTEVSNSIEPTSTNNSNLTVDLINYNPNDNCVTGYVNDSNIWVPDPCFYPVFVYRYGNVAQVNSQAELDAYLNQNWSLTKEKTYTSLGRVSTQNYIDGINSPINGLPMPAGSNNSIVIGIKNDNNVRARPQSGPQNADAVVEVLVEGGMTRFINLFYQSDTNYHGPIRSARPTDPTVLRPVGGVLIASGATGGLIPEIVDMGVPVFTDRRPEYFRISSRNAPHNLYADTAKLKQLAINKGYKKYTDPQPLFPWGNPSLSSWINNSYLKLTFSSYTTTTWTWNGFSYNRTYYDAYKNTSSDNLHYWIDKNGNQGQVTTQTVIALFCEPYIHPLQLPSVKTVGEGRAIILHDGKLLDARWKRGSNLDPFHIVDKNNNILYVPKGKVWISLVPNTKNPSFG